MNRSESAQGRSVLTPRERSKAIASWQAQRKRELEASLAVLEARRRAERNARLRANLQALWPLWLGIFLGLVSPAIAFLAEFISPWCMAVLYPFVVLARRPEIQVGPITHLLPTVMLFVQFPIEGLLARVVMKRNIRPLGVAWHVLMFHFLGIAELWMLNGGARFFVSR